MTKVNVVISDEQILFREGIHFTLAGEEDFEVTGEGANSEDALALTDRSQPDVVIVGMGRDAPAGLAAVTRIKRDCPSVAVILILDHVDDDSIFAAMRSGVNACLSRFDTPEDVVRLAREAGQGGYPIALSLMRAGVASRALKEFEAYASDELLGRLLDRLTAQEVETLQETARLNLETAADAGSADQQVARRLENIRRKLVNNRQHREMLSSAQAQLSAFARPANCDTGTCSVQEQLNLFKAAIEKRLGQYQNTKGEI